MGDKLLNIQQTIWGTRQQNMDPKNRIWSIISQIPKGKVISYGAIARLAGLPGHARYVGYTLKQLPPDSSLPWHRVINSKGSISFKIGSEKYRAQKTRLKNEGVVFSGEKISISQYGWIQTMRSPSS